MKTLMKFRIDQKDQYKREEKQVYLIVLWNTKKLCCGVIGRERIADLQIPPLSTLSGERELRIYKETVPHGCFLVALKYKWGVQSSPLLSRKKQLIYLKIWSHCFKGKHSICYFALNMSESLQIQWYLFLVIIYFFWVLYTCFFFLNVTCR